MKISEVARQLGVHPNTIRRIEVKFGVPINRTWSGYRIYSAEDIERIRKIIFPPRSGDGK